MAVAYFESMFDCFSDFVGLRLPGTEANPGHLSPSVEREHRPERQIKLVGVFEVVHRQMYLLGALAGL